MEIHGREEIENQRIEDRVIAWVLGVNFILVVMIIFVGVYLKIVSW